VQLRRGACGDLRDERRWMGADGCGDQGHAPTVAGTGPWERSQLM
jgi:hypothetical protein